MTANVRSLLNRLRTDAPGCNATALVDLDANMVLTEDSDHPVGQEVWDALATKAVDLLTGAQAEQIARLLDNSADAMFRHATLRRGSDVFVLMRSRAEPPLGLMALGADPFDAGQWVRDATEELETLATSD